MKYLAKTDKNGKYNLSVLVTKVGVNNLSVGYSGNTKYNAYEVNSTFTVGKQNVIVTYNKISDVKKGNNVTNGFIVNPIDTSTTGKKTLTVTYNNKEYTKEIEIVAPVPNEKLWKFFEENAVTD